LQSNHQVQKTKNLALKPNLDPEISLVILFEEINALQRQLKPEKAAISNKSIKEG
jgi:hypothetical protein